MDTFALIGISKTCGRFYRNLARIPEYLGIMWFRIFLLFLTVDYISRHVAENNIDPTYSLSSGSIIRTWSLNEPVQGCFRNEAAIIDHAVTVCRPLVLKKLSKLTIKLRQKLNRKTLRLVENWTGNKLCVYHQAFFIVWSIYRVHFSRTILFSFITAFYSFLFSIYGENHQNSGRIGWFLLEGGQLSEK